MCRANFWTSACLLTATTLRKVIRVSQQKALSPTVLFRYPTKRQIGKYDFKFFMGPANNIGDLLILKKEMALCGNFIGHTVVIGSVAMFKLVGT